MADPLAEILRELGLTNAPVPLPLAQQQAITPTPLDPSAARLPRPRPQVGGREIAPDPLAGLLLDEAELGDVLEGKRSAAEISLERRPLAREGGSAAARGQGKGALTGGALRTAPDASGQVPDDDEGVFSEIGEFFATFGRGVGRGWNRAQQMGPSFQLQTGRTLLGQEVSPVEAAAKFVKQGQEAEAYRTSGDVIEGAKQWAEAKGFWEAGRALAANPDFAANILGESAGQSAPSYALGALGGMAAGPAGVVGGIGTGSGLTEYFSTVSTFLADKKGVDLLDEEQVASAFGNSEWMKEAKVYAAKRGVAVGVFDGLTALVAPKVVSGVGARLGRRVPGVAGTAATPISRVGSGGAGVATESFGGGSGEAAAQLATEGQIDFKDVALESLGETVAGVPELVLATQGGLKQAKSLTRLRPEDFEQEVATGQGPREVDIEEAAAEGRTLYGFDTGESGEVAVGSYEFAEGQAAKKGVRKGRVFAVRPDQVDAPFFTIAAAIEKSGRFDEVVQGPEQGKALLKEAVLLAGQSAKRASGGQLSAQAREKYRQAQAAGVTIDLDALGVDRTKAGLFKGSTRDFGVRFKQVDYGGFSIAGGNLTGILPADMGQNVNDYQDLDLKRVSPGVLQPRAIGVRRAVDQYGLDEVVRLAEEAGTTPEIVQELKQSYQHAQQLELLYDRGLKFVADSRLMSNGAKVADSDEARTEVRGALVKVPEGRNKRGRVSGFQGPMFKTGLLTRQPDIGKVNNIFPSGDVKTRKVVDAAVGSMQKIIDDLKLPFSVDIIPLPSGLPGMYSAADGLFQLETSGRATIAVDGRLHPVQIYSVLFHEFGHFLSAAGLWKMAPETRTRVWASYRRMLEGTKVTGESSRIMSDPLRITNWSQMSDVYEGYVLSFEEWFAEQVARWALTNRRPVGFMARIVRPLAKQLLKAAKLFEQNDPTNKMRAEPEIEKMLEGTFNGKVKAEWSTALSRMHQEETKLLNEKDLKETSLTATPMTAASAAMREMVARLGTGQIMQMAQQAGISIPPMAQVLAGVDKFNWMYKWFLSLPQVADKNYHIQSLQVYRELVQEADTEQSNIMTGAQERLKQWRALGTEQAGALDQFVFGMTRMEYLTPQEQAKGVVRQPTPAEAMALAQQYGLSQEGLTVYRSISQDFRTSLDRYMQLLVQQAQSIVDPKQRQTKLQELAASYRSMLKRPYFPMTRYGKWTLTIRDGTRLEHFETFESKRELQSAHRRAREQYPQGSGFSVTMGVLGEESRPLLGVPPQMLDHMAQSLNLSPQQRADLEVLKFELAPAQSFKKHFMKRKEVSGYSDNAQRNYAHYMFHHAKHYMRVKYQGLLKEQVEATRRALSSTADDRTKVGRIANFMDEHMSEVLNPSQDLAAVRSAVAVWYLGFVPASALLNLTQLGFATGPYLASKFGDVQTFAEMTRAVTSLRNFYRKATIASIQEVEMEALAQGHEEGFIDESQAAELAALTEGSSLLAAVPGVDLAKRWRQLTNLSMMMFQQVEQYNRRVTFRAAWNLAIKNPNLPWLKQLQGKHSLQLARLKAMHPRWTDAQATAFLAAKETVTSTQFEYARYARPKFMQGRKGVAFMFYLFTQNMLFMLGNNKGILPRYLLGMMVMGGMMGLPGAEDGEEIVKAIAARYFGKDFDVERFVRSMVVDVLSDEFVDIPLRGISRIGFGIPQLMDMAGITVMPEVDMSRNISLGRVLPINPAFLVGAPGQSFEAATTKALQDQAGAAFGVGFNIWQAMYDQSTPWSDPKRWERAMPRAARSTAKAARVLYNGKETDRGGNMVAEFDRHDPEQVAEAITMAMGLSPTRLSRAWDKKIAEIEVNTFWDTKREIVMKNVGRAVLIKDKTAHKVAMEALRDYNKEVPFKDKTISAANLKQSLSRRLKDRALADRGLAIRKSGRGVNAHIKELYPDAVAVTPLKRLESR